MAACDDHRNAAVMLAQMSSAMPGEMRAGMPACPPWGFAWHPALWPQYCGAAAAAAAAAPPPAPAERSGSASPSSGDEGSSMRKRGNSQSSGSDSPKIASDDTPRRGSAHHSGTQRRPAREEYTTEGEYLAAYQRWRQVRDRNNDAVKRSREKYKAKKKTVDAPVHGREVQLEDQLETLKTKLVLMARAFSNQALSPGEQEQLKSIVAEYAVAY